MAVFFGRGFFFLLLGFFLFFLCFLGFFFLGLFFFFDFLALSFFLLFFAEAAKSLFFALLFFADLFGSYLLAFIGLKFIDQDLVKIIGDLCRGAGFNVIALGFQVFHSSVKRNVQFAQNFT